MPSIDDSTESSQRRSFLFKSDVVKVTPEIQTMGLELAFKVRTHVFNIFEKLLTWMRKTTERTSSYGKLPEDMQHFIKATRMEVLTTITKIKLAEAPESEQETMLKRVRLIKKRSMNLFRLVDKNKNAQRRSRYVTQKSGFAAMIAKAERAKRDRDTVAGSAGAEGLFSFGSSLRKQVEDFQATKRRRTQSCPPSLVAPLPNLDLF